MRPIEVERVPADNPDFKIIGAGPIGDKAQQLMDKTPRLKELGFHVPHRTVLAQGFLEGFKAAETPLSHTEIIARAIQRYGDTPLMVRSSAAGDSRGTGTYKSVAVVNDPLQVEAGIKEVLASYDTESAVAFRRDAQTGEGFGIIIEPLVGQKVSTEVYEEKFAPIMSGFGYTSTPRGKAFINAVFGIGGGVETRKGERLEREMLEHYDGSLEEYIDKTALRIGMGAEGYKNSDLILSKAVAGHKLGTVFVKPNPEASGLVRSTLDLDMNTRLGFYELNLLPFFDQMEQVEQEFGKPQYLEWALTYDDGNPRFWVVQIADADKKTDSFDFENFGTPLVEGHSVTGTNIVDSDMLVFCRNSESLSELHTFNKNNKGYVLFYWSDMITGGLVAMGRRREGLREINYDDFSNAAVIIELQNSQHSTDPASHFLGKIETTNKLFAATKLDPFDFEHWDRWQSFWEDNQGTDTFKVTHKKVKAVGSERQNRLVIYNQEQE